jgi:hypothetical protein
MKTSPARRWIARLKASWFNSTERSMVTEIWKAGKNFHLCPSENMLGYGASG